jgi:hypothetical protein
MDGASKRTRLWNVNILNFYVEIWAFVDYDTSFACLGDLERLSFVVGHVGIHVLLVLKMKKTEKRIKAESRLSNSIRLTPPPTT